MTLRRYFGFLAYAAVVSFAGVAQADPALQFFTVLTGAQEVPDPVQTSSSGRALAVFDAGFTRVRVLIDLRGPIQVVAAHFHCGRPGANGPIPLGILNPGPLTEIGDHARVTLTDDDFRAADCTSAVGRPVNNIASLALAMRDGLVYLNLHSVASPGGEIRGQMLPLGH